MLAGARKKHSKYRDLSTGADNGKFREGYDDFSRPRPAIDSAGCRGSLKEIRKSWRLSVNSAELSRQTHLSLCDQCLQTRADKRFY